jgi:hypothetical protein
MEIRAMEEGEVRIKVRACIFYAEPRREKLGFCRRSRRHSRVSRTSVMGATSFSFPSLAIHIKVSHGLGNIP